VDEDVVSATSWSMIQEPADDDIMPIEDGLQYVLTDPQQNEPHALAVKAEHLHIFKSIWEWWHGEIDLVSGMQLTGVTVINALAKYLLTTPQNRQQDRASTSAAFPRLSCGSSGP